MSTDQRAAGAATMMAAEQSRSTILLVEDDEAAATMLTDALTARGYRVCWVGSAAEAEAMVEEVRPDLITVDLMLPDVSGLVLCANLRQRWAVPIIICSGTKRRDDAVIGLKLGADDFVAKPFSVDELQARVEAALRRAAPGAAAAPHEEAVLRVGKLDIDHARRRVRLGGREIRLTPTEYRLVHALASRPDQVLSRKELAEAVWGSYDSGIGRTIDVHLRRLRVKLGAGPATSPLVGVRGFGYRLTREPCDEPDSARK